MYFVGRIRLRSLTRHLQSLQELKTNTSNQLHADLQGMFPNEEVTAQLRLLISTLQKQIKDIKMLISNEIDSDKNIAGKVGNICKIKGVDVQTVAVLLAETNGFLLFRNTRQLVSYAGYDVVERQSGKHVGKTRISKKGNSRLRRSLFMPAFNMVRYKVNPFLGLYERTLAKHGIKMKSYVAIQKKLLVLIYTLWKNNVPFDAAHDQKPSEENDSGLSLGTSAVAEDCVAA